MDSRIRFFFLLVQQLESTWHSWYSGPVSWHSWYSPHCSWYYHQWWPPHSNSLHHPHFKLSSCNQQHPVKFQSLNCGFLHLASNTRMEYTLLKLDIAGYSLIMNLTIKLIFLRAGFGDWKSLKNSNSWFC